MSDVDLMKEKIFELYKKYEKKLLKKMEIEDAVPNRAVCIIRECNREFCKEMIDIVGVENVKDDGFCKIFKDRFGKIESKEYKDAFKFL